MPNIYLFYHKCWCPPLFMYVLQFLLYSCATFEFFIKFYKKTFQQLRHLKRHNSRMWVYFFCIFTHWITTHSCSSLPVARVFVRALFFADSRTGQRFIRTIDRRRSPMNTLFMSLFIAQVAGERIMATAAVTSYRGWVLSKTVLSCEETWRDTVHSFSENFEFFLPKIPMCISASSFENADNVDSKMLTFKTSIILFYFKFWTF